MEQTRQFVIFGNFSKINFENLNKISDFKQKYSFQIDAQPDMPNVSVKQPIVQENLPIRPVFKSLDGKTIIFFGSSRIHVQQINSKIDSYQDFNKLALEMIKAITLQFELSINRLAINGTLIVKNEEKINELYKMFFKENGIFSSDSDEWQFRVNDKEFIEEINSGINKIIFLNRTKINESNSTSDVLLVSYDYNTQINSNNKFQMSQIEKFNIFAQDYREKIINL